ncbi:hypothetical protein Ddc_20537 [Ditylenchus destructor]|nr:hypothetical protein Ddc_20537 [Ditylenchus destructor]
MARARVQLREDGLPRQREIQAHQPAARPQFRARLVQRAWQSTRVAGTGRPGPRRATTGPTGRPGRSRPRAAQTGQQPQEGTVFNPRRPDARISAAKRHQSVAQPAAGVQHAGAIVQLHTLGQRLERIREAARDDQPAPGLLMEAGEDQPQARGDQHCGPAGTKQAPDREARGPAEQRQRGPAQGGGGMVATGGGARKSGGHRCRRSMHLDAAGRLALAGASRGVAQAADVMLGDLVRMRHEMAAALAALGHRQHAVVDELDQAPGPRHRQQLLQTLGLGLLVVELEGLDDHVDLVHLRDLVQVLVDVEEQRGVDVGLPGHEPVRRERQLTLAGALARDFLVQAQQALVAQVRFRLQHLQAGAQVDQRHGALDLLGFGQDGLGTHVGVSGFSSVGRRR